MSTSTNDGDRDDARARLVKLFARIVAREVCVVRAPQESAVSGSGDAELHRELTEDRSPVVAAQEEQVQPPT
jgi:hypothetical protein